MVEFKRKGKQDIAKRGKESRYLASLKKSLRQDRYLPILQAQTSSALHEAAKMD